MAAPFSDARYELQGGVQLVRPVTAEDAGRLGLGFAAMEPWSRYPYSASALSAYLIADEPGAPRFGILVNGVVQGALGLRGEWLRGPYLQFIGLLAPVQGRGIGSRCLSWIETQARHSGARNLWVAASDFNIGAMNLYERAGFKRIADLDDLVVDGRSEVLFRKRLG